MTKCYSALNAHGHAITSVLAESEEEAKQRITEQLNRLGRRKYYRQWCEAGKPIKIKKEVTP